MNKQISPPARASQLQVYSCAVFALVVWSGTPIANKIAINYMSGLQAGVLRSVSAGLIAFALVLIMRMPFPKQGKQRLLLSISGIASFAMWPLLMSIGLEYTSAGHAALIMALIPVFTVLFSNLLCARWPNWRWCFGATVAILGTLMLIAGRPLVFSLTDYQTTLKGDLLILLGCIVCAWGYVAGARSSIGIGSRATTFWGLALALVVLIPVFFSIVDYNSLSTIDTTAWLAIAWLVLFSSLLAYIAWLFALERGGIAKIGSIQLSMPVLTLIAAVFILAEDINSFIIFACVLILFGAYLAQRNSA